MWRWSLDKEVAEAQEVFERCRLSWVCSILLDITKQVPLGLWRSSQDPNTGASGATSNGPTLG